MRVFSWVGIEDGPQSLDLANARSVTTHTLDIRQIDHIHAHIHSFTLYMKAHIHSVYVCGVATRLLTREHAANVKGTVASRVLRLGSLAG